MQSVAMLQTMLDPSLSASLPGAASALTEAVVAEQDAATLASTELARQDARLGTRGRGQDASSQARQQLATQGQQQGLQAQTSTAEQASLESIQHERAEIQPQLDAGRNREGSEPSREVQPQDSGAQHGAKQQSNAGNLQSNELSETGQSAHAGKRGEGAFAAVSTSLPQAGVTASATSSSGAAQVSSVGKVTPPAASGQATDQRTSVAGAKKQVIRHEPRTIDAQLQRGLAQVLRQKGGTLSLRLNPVDLGDVKISLSIAQGRVDGSIEASNESARGLLEQNLDKLKSSLERRGITVDRLEVRLAGASSSETQNAQGQDARADLNQQHADAGSGRQQDSASGEDRQRGSRGRIPDESAPAGLRGAESAADDDAAQGSAAEPLGGWLRLDTLA
jgi:flagellar hook-length control protein FliK